MDIGRRIQKRREILGLTREQLAERMGVTATTIYRKERGQGESVRGINAAELMDFAEALECGVDDLLPTKAKSEERAVLDKFSRLEETQKKMFIHMLDSIINEKKS